MSDEEPEPASADPLGRKHAVAAIIERNGRYLLGKRSPRKRSAPLYWCPLCGGVEPGETHAEAVVREVREESGLAVVARREFAQCPTRDGSVLIHWWVVDIVGGAEPKPLGDEHTELRWVEPSELEGLYPQFEEDFDILRAHDACRRGPR